MSFFFMPQSVDDLLEGLLHATAIQRQVDTGGVLQATMAVGEEQAWMMVYAPEAAQQVECPLGQRDQAVFVAFGVAHMHALTVGVDIADLQAQALTEPQTETVQGKEEDLVAQDGGCGEHLPYLFNRKDVWNSRGFGWLDQRDILPRLT